MVLMQFFWTRLFLLGHKEKNSQNNCKLHDAAYSKCKAFINCFKCEYNSNWPESDDSQLYLHTIYHGEYLLFKCKKVRKGHAF